MDQGDPFCSIGSYDSMKAATAAAARLVEQGLGASPVKVEPAQVEPAQVEPAQQADASGEPASTGWSPPAAATLVEPDTAVPATEPTYAVSVLKEDAVRACELLGVAVPENAVDDEPSGPPWRLIVLIWLASLIVLPLLAFWLTVSLAE